jgi:4-amino-4-deoxy-L-arabinose transferase-like glycosyltransferase
MSRKTTLLLLGTVLTAAFLRTWRLTTTPPGLYPDEAMNGSNALEALRTHQFQLFYPENNGREGLFVNVQALGLAMIGVREPWVLRFPAALFGIATVAGLFFLVRELWQRDDIALLASFFLATSFWHITLSRVGFRAITAPFFLVWALYFFLRSMRQGPLLAAIAGVFFGLGFYSYIAYRGMPLLLLLFIPFFRPTPHFRRATALFVSTAFVVAAPIGWYFVQHPSDFFGRTTQVAVKTPGELATNAAKTIRMLDFEGDANWRHNVPGRPEVFWPVGICFWAGVALGISEIARRRDGRLAYLLLFGWLLLAAVPVAISNEGTPHALRALLMVCPIFAIAGVGGAWLLAKVPASFRRSVAALFAVALLAEAYATYFTVWASDPNVPYAFNAEYVDIGRRVRALPDATPKYVIVAAGGVLVNGIPVPAQTVMFMTDTYSPERQREHNVHYVVPGDGMAIPPGAQVFYVR